MLENRIGGRPVVLLKLTNCYGLRLRIRDARQTFLANWMRQVLRGQPFEVWGGAQLRDLTFVDDLTEAFLRAAETPACFGQIYNIRGTPPISLRALADLLVDVAGDGASYEMPSFPEERAKIDIGSYYADDSAFQAAALVGHFVFGETLTAMRVGAIALISGGVILLVV